MSLIVTIYIAGRTGQIRLFPFNQSYLQPNGEGARGYWATEGVERAGAADIHGVFVRRFAVNSCLWTYL